MILDIYKKIQKLMGVLQSTEVQGEYFDAQKASIQQLLIDERFTYVVEYWELEAKKSMDKLADPKTPLDTLQYWQARHNVAMDFLNFLQALSG